MYDIRGLALGLTDRSPFALPTRPSRPERSPEGEDGASTLARSFRAAIAQALDDYESGWLPRLSRYPY